MPFFLKSCSQTVHEVSEEHRQEDYGLCKSLTVWKSSLVLSCNGFAVIDSNGDLVYRVDNYSARQIEIVLMDGYGKSLFTISRRKERLRLVENWLIYQGESVDKNSADTKNDPIFIARKQLKYMRRQNVNVLALVYITTSDKRHPAYIIEGSYAQRSCKIYDKSRNIVAEIKKKEAAIRSGGGVSFGSEVFVLIVRPGFDQGFAMALVCCLIKCSLNLFVFKVFLNKLGLYVHPVWLSLTSLLIPAYKLEMSESNSTVIFCNAIEASELY